MSIFPAAAQKTAPQRPLGFALTDTKWATQQAQQAAAMDPAELDRRVIECREKGLNKPQSTGPCLRLVEYQAHEEKDADGKTMTVVDQAGVGSDDISGFDAAWARVDAADAINALAFDTKAKYVAALNETGIDGAEWAAGLMKNHGVTTWANLKRALSPDV